MNDITSVKQSFMIPNVSSGEPFVNQLFVISMITIFQNIFIRLYVVIAMTLIFVGAYVLNVKRNVVSSNADITSHRKSRPRNFFLDQPFIGKAIGLQSSVAIQVRDRTIGQRALRDMSLKDRVIYQCDFSIFHHQPNQTEFRYNNIV